jgi:D-alanyl-lipoteichoic acid acyltransferase DltB (MBOAT superfamily)
VGLFKKLVLADGFAGFVNPVYAMAEAGAVPGAAAAWSAAIAYVFQLYFDFSGYSDMAIGLARCFGIVLPINFNSPYKAVSLSEFWRRWHITLVRFVRSYFFQPIALFTSRFVSRRRWSRRTQKIVSLSFPTVVIFTAIGLWHGAGWTFVVFGLVHGGLVTLEQLTGFPGRRRSGPLVLRVLRRVWLPLVLVTTFVIFRAPDIDTAMRVFAGMAATGRLGGVPGTSWFVLAALGTAITLLAPNIYQMTARYRPVLVARDSPTLDPLPKRFRHWRPSPGYAFATAGVFIVAVVSMARGVVEFIYFDF